MASSRSGNWLKEILEEGDSVGEGEEKSMGNNPTIPSSSPSSTSSSSLALDMERLSIFQPEKKKKLLVLDMNGLLAHTFQKCEKVTIPSGRSPDGVFNKKLVFKRPCCDEFLRFCFDRFEVGIWSSAQKKNVEAAVACVMGKLRSKLVFIWAQSECTTNPRLKTLENKRKPLFLKELKKLWDGGHSAASLPWRPGRFSSSNTLLIDDSPYKALLNPPNTAIFPDPYTVEDEGDASLGEEGELRMFLKGLADANDVPTYVAAHRIGQGAITSADEGWSYYSDIISELSSASIA